MEVYFKVIFVTQNLSFTKTFSFFFLHLNPLFVFLKIVKFVK